MSEGIKKETSLQYQVSNVVFFDEIYGNWIEFHNHLKTGLDDMQKYMLELWNRTREKLSKNENIILKDKDKKVKATDFDVTMNQTNKGTMVLFFTFPDYDDTDAASKYVALALTPNLPRYFTLEYSKHVLDNTPCWVVGEFILEKSGVKHINHGQSDNMRLSWFAGYVIGLLEQENL